METRQANSLTLLNLISGQTLTVEGRETAEALSATLADLGVTALYASPYVRAKETLVPFAEHTGLAINLDARLRERTLSSADLPDWREHIARSFVDRDYCAPGGESFNEVAARALAAISDIAAAHHALPAVATHGNLLSSLFNLADPQFGFGDWQSLRNPDLFMTQFGNNTLLSFRRV